jgi:hypothetical protein
VSETLHDRIAKAITDIPVGQPEEVDTPDDEIVAALERQLDVLEGTAVVLGNVVQMLVMQIGNLRSEVALFSEPEQSRPVEPQRPEIARTGSGAIVAESLPVEKRTGSLAALTFCGHEDSLIVQTADGPVKVCPDCDSDPGG